MKYFMKRLVFIAFAFSGLVACSSNDNKTLTKEAAKEETKTNETPIADHPDYAAGLALIAKSDCLSCHKVDAPLVGPPYREVANKYAIEAPGIIPKLAEKVIKGGTGVWGQVPMLAHPSISQADAETMIKYILLLKK